MANEAYVKVSEVLKDAPAAASTSSSLLVAGAIKSRYGRFDVTHITSRKELLDKFTCDGKLSGKCDISLINAYVVLGSFPLLVARAAQKEYEGIELGLDSNPFTSEYDNPFGNVVAAFDIKFNDFMKDSSFKVNWEVKKSESYPGAVDLSIKYIKKSDLFRYTFVEVVSAGDVTIGETYDLESPDGKSIIKFKVTGLVDSQYTGTLVTKVGVTDCTEFSSTSPELIVDVTSTPVESESVRSYNVTFSIDESVTDDKGNSLYYKNVWDDSWPFEVTVGDVSPVEVTVPNPYVSKDPTQSDSLTYLDYGPVAAQSGTLDTTIAGMGDVETDVFDDVNDPSGTHWSKLENFEGMQVPLLTDFGTPNIGSQLKLLANVFNAMYLISLPRKLESVNGANIWDDVDLGNSRRYACTPFVTTSDLGFLATIAPTTQYLITLANNIQAGREFEAIAGSTTGVVSYKNLTKRFNKAEREKLLDLKINTIGYNESDDQAYFNDDLTGLVQNNPFKEEFNRRLGVRIAQDIEETMKQFKFQLNTASLRDTVTSVLENYFDTASFKDKIWAYEVICNDDNNPKQLQAQNKLAVTVNIAFYYTAKYIEVVNNIYSVGQSFTE